MRVLFVRPPEFEDRGLFLDIDEAVDAAEDIANNFLRLAMTNLYSLTGRGSSLNGRLGLELQSRGFELHGRVLDGDFVKFSFPEQVDHVAADFRELDGRDTPIIVNSWGAYWALHALLQNQNSCSRILLIAPILGAVRAEGRMFKPLLSKVMKHAIDDGLFPEMDLTILVGSDDWQSPDNRCEALCEDVQGKLVVADVMARAMIWGGRSL